VGTANSIFFSCNTDLGHAANARYGSKEKQPTKMAVRRVSVWALSGFFGWRIRDLKFLPDEGLRVAAAKLPAARFGFVLGAPKCTLAPLGTRMLGLPHFIRHE
jgi:hypothetical protein